MDKVDSAVEEHKLIADKKFNEEANKLKFA